MCMFAYYYYYYYNEYNDDIIKIAYKIFYTREKQYDDNNNGSVYNNMISVIITIFYNIVRNARCTAFVVIFFYNAHMDNSHNKSIRRGILMKYV